jgi:hypothetical protein
MTKIGLPLLLLLGLTTGPAVLAQDSGAGATGLGAALGAINDIQETLEQQWEGRPGRFAKGGIGTAGAALAIGSALEALSYEATIRADGRVRRGSSIGTSDGDTSPTTTSTSTATSTN